LWFTGCFIGQAYFLAGLEHPVVGPFAVVAVVVVEDLIANWTSYFLQTWLAVETGPVVAVVVAISEKHLNLMIKTYLYFIHSVLKRVQRNIMILVFKYLLGRSEKGPN
jgi:hypothetical protein